MYLFDSESDYKPPQSVKSGDIPKLKIQPIEVIAHKIALEFPYDYLLPSDKGLISDTSDLIDIPGMILSNLTYGHSNLDQSMNNAGYDFISCNKCNRVIYKKHNYKLNPQFQSNNYKDYYEPNRCKCGNCHFLIEFNINQATLLKPFMKDTSATINEITEFQNTYFRLEQIPKVSRSKQISLYSILPSEKSKFTNLLFSLPSAKKYLSDLGFFEDKTFIKIPDFMKFGGLGNPSDICGDFMVYYCRECHTYHSFKHQCNKRECPNCFKAWKYQSGKKASERLWYGRQFLIDQGYFKGRFIHCTISFDMTKLPLIEDITPRDLDLLKKIAINNAKSHGITGGIVICHIFRESKPGVYDYPGIHFHLIAYAPSDIIPGGQIFDKDLVFKNIRTLYSENAIQRVVSYQLGHCVITDKKHSINYFGDFSYNNLNQKYLSDKYPEIFNKPKRLCPNCNSDGLVFIEINRPPVYYDGDYFPYDT